MSEFEFLRLIEISGAVARLLALCGLEAIMLIGLTWILAKSFCNYRAAIRHNLWLVGLLAVAVLPFRAIFSRFFPLSETIAQTLPQFGELPAIFRLFDGEKSTGVFTFSNAGWLEWAAMAIVFAWLVGVFICLVRLATEHLKVNRICRTAQAISVDENFYKSLQIPARVSLLSSSQISNPLLVGVLRPTILLPAEIERWMSWSEIQAIVRHELAHYERGDYLIRPLQSLLVAFFFFHPLVRYASNQLDLERESACDERVLDSDIAPENYKEVILKVAEQDVLKRESCALAFNPAKKILTRRINRIMSNQTKSMSKLRRYFVTANFLLLLACAVWFATPNIVTAQAARQTSTTDEETFRKLYEEMRQIIIKGDRAAFEQFFADDYTAISSRGNEMTKKQVVETHIQKPTADTRLEAVNFSELKVRVSGDNAVVSYLAEMSGVMKGNKFSQRARITDVWERKDGKWLSVASHASVAQ